MNQHCIKFRGKKTSTNEWVYGDFLQHYPHHKGATIVENGCIYHEVIPETVGQFIGTIKDDEIYINDLIQHGQTIRIVEYRNGNTSLLRKSGRETILLSFSDNPKKVGNIFDNPDLLDGQF